MDLGLDVRRPAIPWQAARVILLDTNALIWADQRHPRIRPLLAGNRPLYISPATVLELQFLQESGRIRLRDGSVHSIVNDDRWLLDDPPAAPWFLRAVELVWTRDPFDRLLAAHAQLREWRLATSDGHLLDELGPAGSLEL